MGKTDIKVLARNKVYRAVRAGRLVRPERCERCRVTCQPEASHDDYNRPLEVEWLCRLCHRRKDFPLSDRCPHGHLLAGENLMVLPTQRKCRECHRRSDRESKRAKRGRVDAS